MEYVAVSKFNGLDTPCVTLLDAAETGQDAPLAGILLFDAKSKFAPVRSFRPLRVKIEAVRAWRIEDALLSDEFIVHRGKEIFVDCSYHCSGPAQVGAVRARLAARVAAMPAEVDERYARESALVFHNEGGGTWGHFLIQLLPRALAYLQQFSQGKLAVPVPHLLESNAYGEALRAYGIDPARMLPVERGRTYKFRELILADIPYNIPAQMPHPAMLARLSAPEVPDDGEVIQGRPLFVSRASATRQIVNQAALEAVLDRYGIEKMELGRQPFAAQVRRWRTAPFVVGTLGSDLTNLIFAAPGTPLLVISPDWFGDEFFYNLAQARRLRWNELRCGQMGERREPEHTSSFRVDIERFETLLRSVMPQGMAGPARFVPVTPEERTRIFQTVIRQRRGTDLPRRLVVACGGIDAQIWAALEPLGFTAIGADDLAAETMVPSFAGAELLVLLGEAGLHEARFCAPGTPVILAANVQAGDYLASLELVQITPGEGGVVAAVQDVLTGL